MLKFADDLAIARQSAASKSNNKLEHFLSVVVEEESRDFSFTLKSSGLIMCTNLFLKRSSLSRADPGFFKGGRG